MTASKDKVKVKIQTVVDKNVADQIDYFAERFEVSQSRMAALILEVCLETDSGLMEAMSSRAVKKVLSAFGMKKKPVINFEGGGNG